MARKLQGNSSTSSIPKLSTRGATAAAAAAAAVMQTISTDQEDMEEDPNTIIDPITGKAEVLALIDQPCSPLAATTQLAVPLTPETPEWVLAFQQEFRAHEQRIASLEFAMGEIVRLKSELETANSALAAANAQIASLQKQMLVRTDAGNFPPLPFKPKSARIVQQNLDFATVTKRKKKKPLKSILRIFEHPRVPTSSTSEGPQYMYVYVPNKYRKKLARYRADLRDIGFDTGRILDIHYPAKGVAAILIHSEYSKEFHEVLTIHKVEPIIDFDQFAPSNLNDPSFGALSDVERVAKARELQQVRLARGIKHARSYLRNAIAREFEQQGFLSRDQVKVILKGGSISATKLDDEVDISMADSQQFDAFTELQPPASATGADISTSAGNGEPAYSQ